MSFFDLYDNVYEDQYERTYNFTKRALKGDLEKDVETLEETIKTLWDYQGLDWLGRGEIFLAKNNATIAATEKVLTELKEEQHDEAS